MSTLPDATSVANWARQTSEGDHRNAENLANYLRSLLVKRFGQLGLNAEESQELAQECLIDVLQNLAKFDSERSAIATWVSGFARTSIRSWRRREYGRRTSEITYDVAPEVAVPDSTIERMENSFGSSLLKLNVIDRELLHMRFNLGLSFDEIAERANMTSVNARKRLSRAVDRLRRDPELREVMGLETSAI
ncbi:MAG: sigma-70 family RNA polymerase sigma factor [Armatimonadetes bacterium]|nr:sigma-70 family RNA polymerase sigma factor [Armatimonadota bacterium]